jgi:hypothetical protein
MRSAESSGAVIFSKHFFFVCSACRLFQRAGGLFPSPPFCATTILLTHNHTVRYISFFCALLAGYFSGLAANFPPPLFVPLRYYYSTHNHTVRPRHRCLSPLRCCRRHPLPLVPPAAYCVTVAVIGPPPLPSPLLDRHRAAAAPPAPPPPLHLNVALDVRNLAASLQRGLLPVV